MLRITIDIIPYGIEERKKTLSIMQIWNTCDSGTLSRGNYKFWISKRGMPHLIWKEGTIKNFPRKRLGAWDLLLRCLLSVLEERNT